MRVYVFHMAHLVKLNGTHTVESKMATHRFSDLLRHQHEPCKIFVQLGAPHLVCGKTIMLPDKDLEAGHSRLRCSNTSGTATNRVPSGNMTLWLGCSRSHLVSNDRKRNTDSISEALAFKESLESRRVTSIVLRICHLGFSMSSTFPTWT